MPRPSRPGSPRLSRSSREISTSSKASSP
jgi:hypothetical protein